MPYQNIDLPQGMHANGTLYQNRWKWYDGDRVRWHNGALRPIGGWGKFNSLFGPLDQAIPTPAENKARTVLSWRSNTGDALYAAGHNAGLVTWSGAAQTVFDITPVGFVPRPFGPIVQDGYGEWFYGSDSYGTPRPFDQDDTDVFNWVFRNWGQNLLVAEREAPSNLYEWDTVFANPAVLVPNAPTDFNCMHVTDQRIVMVAGSPLEPRKVSWSDSENNNEWLPSITNQAGSQTLPGIGKFKEIVTVQDQILLVSETDAYVARYLGPPYIYGFDKIGDGCGVQAGAAVVVTENFAIWPGSRNFFIFDGSTVKEYPCEVMDRVAATLNSPQGNKTVGYANSDWSEVWWLYQSGDTDVDSYVSVNWVDNNWSLGTLDRSVGGGIPQLHGPLMIGQDGFVYSHEIAGTGAYDTDPNEVWAITGPLEIGAGDTTAYISYMQPDIIFSGEVDVTFIGQDRPTGPKVTFGPYRIEYPANTNQPVSTRARGHTLQMLIEGANSLWTLGSNRLDFTQGGKK